MVLTACVILKNRGAAAVTDPRKFIILLYDVSWGRCLLRPAENDPLYEFTHVLTRLPEADVVIFHVPTAPNPRRARKYRGQKWVAYSLESDVNYPRLRDPEYMSQFDLTMTYRWDSDVPLMYWWPELRAALSRPPMPKKETPPAVFFSSNLLEKSGRTEYARELMRYIPIDCYGRAFPNRSLAEDSGRETKLTTISRYRFDLAFENSISRDYLSEKFFDSLAAGCVPVYRGAPNIEEFAPGDHCFINAADFHGPRELAEFLLHLTHHPAEYEAYFAWKTRPWRDAFLQKIAIAEVDPFHRLAEKIRGRGTLPRASSVWGAIPWPWRRRTQAC